VIRPVSSKRAVLLRERRELLARAEPTSCERCHAEPAVDGHELVRRSQYRVGAAEVDMIWPIGRACHEWVTTHPVEAEAEGWHVPYHAFASVRRSARQASDRGAIVTAMSDTPPSGDNRVTLRISDAGHAFVDALMAETNSDRSAVLRAMFAVASQRRAEIIAKLRPAGEPEPFDRPARTASPVPKPSQGGRC
jgi:hypothetical protein